MRKIAENAGTSENQILATYQRLNNILNKDELGFFKDKVEDTFVGDG